MKTAQSVEIAYLMNGGVVSQRRLSRRGEWRAGMAALALVAGMSARQRAGRRGGAAGRAPRGLRGAYLVVWLLAGAGASMAAAVARGTPGPLLRDRRGIDDDAFSSSTLPLVRRTSAGYVMRLAPGMTGQLEAGRAPIPLES